ncbi:MAG: transposase [Campylobacterota bacterium]|nr:transposase [Campylobacterota bacterium]
MRYEKEFKEKAVKLVVASKGAKSIREIAIELNISKDTLYTWVKKAKESTSTDTKLQLSDKLQMLHETYSMSEEEVNAYCRVKGIFKHQLQEWEREFLNKNTRDDSSTKEALQKEKSHSQALAKELRRKEKALAETAALLVLQKKFQALLEDEEL